jgi:hypothetical protein
MHYQQETRTNLPLSSQRLPFRALPLLDHRAALPHTVAFKIMRYTQLKNKSRRFYRLPLVLQNAHTPISAVVGAVSCLNLLSPKVPHHGRKQQSSSQGTPILLLFHRFKEFANFLVQTRIPWRTKRRKDFFDY